MIAQGDTTSVFAAALASFYRQVPFLHVEAGLRSFNLRSPFPEEFNRVAISKLVYYAFSAPTEAARKQLLAEGVDEGSIFVTGNTVIDTLLTLRQTLG